MNVWKIRNDSVRCKRCNKLRKVYRFGFFRIVGHCGAWFVNTPVGSERFDTIKAAQARVLYLQALNEAATTEAL